MHAARRTWLQWLALTAGTTPTATWAAGAPLDVVDARRRLQFPRDFGAHPDTRTEWWYVTGEVQATEPAGAGAGSTLGFQVTFFRSRVDAVPADHPSPLAARHLVLAHAALSDVGRQRLWHDQRLARAVLSQAGASTDDTRVWLRDWTLQRDAAPVGSAGEHYRTRIAARDFQLDLQLHTGAMPLLQGHNGHSQKGPERVHASHYYTRPQLRVSGQIERQGRRQGVQGRAWLDHEWSEALLAPEAVGWDWIGMNLHDGSALTAFRLRRADGSTLWAGGSHRDASGRLMPAFGPDEVRFEALRHWQSPRTGARYPVRWQVVTPAGSFRVEARFDAQELDSRASGSPTYWEGLSTLSDLQGRPVGSGYLEMTGYAEKLSF